MEAKDCKIGMRVRFRAWEDMEREYGLDEDGDIGGPGCFSAPMRPLCGTCATIESVDGNALFLTDFESDGKTLFWYEPFMFEPANTGRRAADPAYKHGDRVMIVDKWGAGRQQNQTGKMDKWLGKIMTVLMAGKDKDGGISYVMVEDRMERVNGWVWHQDDIAGKVDGIISKAHSLPHVFLDGFLKCKTLEEAAKYSENFGRIKETK